MLLLEDDSYIEIARAAVLAERERILEILQNEQISDRLRLAIESPSFDQE